MAKPAEVTIGPFEDVDGGKIVYPIPLRNVNLWVSWSTDPGDAFSASDLVFDPIARLREPNAITFVKRIDNRFLFNVRLRGMERYASFTIPENTFGGNAETRLVFPVMSYGAVISQVSVPTSLVTTRSTSGVMLRDNRGRNTYWQKDGFSLEGEVNGNYYSSREAIVDLNLPGVNTDVPSLLGQRFTSQRVGNDFAPTIRLPDKSSGSVRVRVDKFAHYTYTGGFNERRTEAFAGRGPGRDFTTDYFEFDTTGTTQIALRRGAEGSHAIPHAENSEMLLIDQILDVSDTRWMVKPLNELEWRSDTSQLYNQVRVLYGEGREHFTENPQSVFDNGGREFTMRTPLAGHQTQWVRWLAQNVLDTFSELQYTARLELKLSLHLRIGQTVLLRGLQQDRIDNIVQIVGIEHNIARQMSVVTVRTIRRATPQSLTAPAFATNVFTSGATLTLVRDSIWTGQLEAFGNPTPTITVMGNPSWMTVDERGNIRATPTAVGSHVVTFTASNGQSPDATFTLTFNVVIPNQWNSGYWDTFFWGT